MNVLYFTMYLTLVSSLVLKINALFLLPWSSLTTHPQANTKALKQYTGLSGPSYSLTGLSGTQKYALPSAAVLQVLAVYIFLLSISLSLVCKPLHWYQIAFRSFKGNWAWLCVQSELWISLEESKNIYVSFSSVRNQRSLRFIIFGASLWFD